MSLDANDRVQIHDLYARYALYFDNRDPEGWAGIFCEDGRFVLEEGEVAGRAALAAFAKERMELAPGIRHYTTNVCIDATARGAHGQAYVLVLCKRRGEALRLRTMGSYEDELIREDGAWRFALRRFSPWILPEEAGKAFSFDLAT